MKRLAGDNYRVRDREAQHALLHKIMRRWEKLAVFLILTFILIIATSTWSHR